MAALIPIPTSRVSNLLVRQRMLEQLQGNQLDIFRLQNQVSTGRRITRPSDDAPAAQRAIALQRLLERKGQLQSNVDAANSYLVASDSALNDVATLLGDIRGSALGVAGTTSSDVERQAVSIETTRALEQLVQVGNREFRGRYLFAGSQTNVLPYAVQSGSVRYSGNGGNVDTFSDVDVLFSTNAAGGDVFGGSSADAVGGTDLDPHLSADTPLASLRRGQGISADGAVLISDGVNASVVDVSSATTLGDVVRLIEENPPSGRTLSVSITASGLTLQLDSSGGGNLTVDEVGSGRTAAELGIRETSGVLTNPLVGDDLDPVILRTTRLADLAGSKARARLVSSGGNNDVLVEAAANGAAYNGAVQYVDDDALSAAAGIAAGNEYAVYSSTARAARASLAFTGTGNDLTVTATATGTDFNQVRIVVAGQAGLGDAATAAYDSLNKRLMITVDDAGATTVQRVVAAINGTGQFTAAHDASVEGSYNATALIAAGDIANVQGNTSNSGGAAGTLYVHVDAGVTTASQAVEAINAEATFTARLDDSDATDFSLAGTQPIDATATATAAGGGGAVFDAAAGLRIVNGGQTHVVDFDDAETVEDLLNVLNGSAAGVLAEINDDGSGINLRSRLSGQDFQIGENGGQTATQLGVRTLAGGTSLDDLNYGHGVPRSINGGSDLRIVAKNNLLGDTFLDIDLSDASTVQDVIDRINGHVTNHTGGVDLLARQATVGNGIEIVDQNGRPLTIQAVEGSQAAENLGLVAAGTTETTSASGVITGSDRNFRETSSVYTTLIRLRDALDANDVEEIGRAIAMIDADIDRVSFARSDVGARQQALDLSKRSLQDEDVQLQSALSDTIDVDLVEAISNLVARQSSMQASLQATANILQLSLLDFL